jgi:uncharacterized protein (DUF433 family)
MTVEQKAKLGRVVWIDPDRMSGAPCFTGTRVPVRMLLDHLKHSDTIEDFLEGAPTDGAPRLALATPPDLT